MGRSTPRSGAASALAVAAFVAVAVLGAGCTPKKPPSPGALPPGSPPPLGTQRPYQINGVWYYPIPSAEGFREEGYASWYGRDFHGRATACGEPFDMYAMTAAHKILPIGTHVKVTDKRTGRSIIVRINDRGPFVAGRIIDLSYEAARALGIHNDGLAPVIVEAVRVTTPVMAAGSAPSWQVEPVRPYRQGPFVVQVGSFQNADNAQRLKREMDKRYGSAAVRTALINGTAFYRVQLGVFPDLDRAMQSMETLQRNGYRDAFVIALEGQ